MYIKDGGNVLNVTCETNYTCYATYEELSITNVHSHVSINCAGTGLGYMKPATIDAYNRIIEN